MSHIEDSIAKTGWGLYHHFLIGFSALCHFSHGLASMSLPLYIPMMACDIPMTENIIISINICYSIGMLLGGFFFSSLSDVVGRKNMVTFTSIVIFTSILGTSFAYGSISVVILQIFVGAGLAANLNVVKINLAETLPNQKRGTYLVLLDIFWTLGCILGLVLAWIFTPIVFKYRSRDARIFTWRILYGLSGSLSIMMACASALLLESVRYLLYEKRTPEALYILREIYAVNNSKNLSYYNVIEDELHGKIADFGINRDIHIQHRYASRRGLIILKRIHKSMLTLVSRKFFFSTLHVIVLKLLTSIGVLVLNMWLTKTLYYNEKCYFTGIDLLHFSNPTLEDCSHPSMESTLYRDYLILSVHTVMGQIILMGLINHIERKCMIFSGLFLAGLFSLLLAFVRNSYIIRFVISALFMVCYSIVESGLNIIIVEMFPTAVRGTAVGETQILARVAGIFMKKYLQTSCVLSFIAVTIVMEVAAGLALLLPKFKGRPMVE